MTVFPAGSIGLFIVCNSKNQPRQAPVKSTPMKQVHTPSKSAHHGGDGNSNKKLVKGVIKTAEGIEEIVEQWEDYNDKMADFNNNLNAFVEGSANTLEVPTFNAGFSGNDNFSYNIGGFDGGSY